MLISSCEEGECCEVQHNNDRENMSHSLSKEDTHTEKIAPVVFFLTELLRIVFEMRPKTSSFFPYFIAATAFHLGLIIPRCVRRKGVHGKETLCNA